MRRARRLAHPVARAARWLLIAAAAATMSCSGRAPRDDPGLHADEIRQVVAACSLEMLRSTCRVANDRSSSSAPAASSVFVAGVGPIDATAYRSLRDAGDAMCGHVARSCTSQWAGSACRTARSLWGAR